MKYLNHLVLLILFMLLSCSKDTPLGVDSQKTVLNSNNPVSLAKKNTKKKNKGKIVFVSNRDGDDEIFVMNADGTGQTQLTDNTLSDVRPSWSHNGRKIVFIRGEFGNRDIYIMNADGSGQINLTNNPGGYWNPNWSPNGKKIAFNGIGVINVDGSGETQLTEGGGHPSWSPNGKKIAFHNRQDGGQPDIYVMNADGTDQIRLTTNQASDKQPSWSPNGKKIAFSSTRTGRREIYVMNVDGSGQRQLTTNGGAHPEWSPDGKKIVFHNGNSIFVINDDGSGQPQLVSNEGVHPDWGRGKCRICSDWTKNPENGHYYRLTEPMSWMDAEAQAQEWSGHLVTLNNWEEELWIKNTFGDNVYLWLGFNDVAEEGIWVWSSGENVTYTHWADGEPNDYRGEDAAVMNWCWEGANVQDPCLGDYWNDLAADATLVGVVEKKHF